MHPAIAKYIPADKPTDECWRWEGPSYPTGGPKVVFSGQTLGARRLIFEIETGKTARGDVMMSCGNVTCVNHRHMVG